MVCMARGCDTFPSEMGYLKKRQRPDGLTLSLCWPTGTGGIKPIANNMFPMLWIAKAQSEGSSPVLNGCGADLYFSQTVSHGTTGETIKARPISV